jgi:hypothetical protein
MATLQGIIFSQGNDGTMTWNPLRQAVKINKRKWGGKQIGEAMWMRDLTVAHCAHLCERLRLYNPVNPAPLQWASCWSIIFSLLLDFCSIFYNLANPLLLLDSFNFCTNISTRCWLLALPRCFLQSACSWHYNNNKVCFGLFSLPSLLCVSCCLCASQFFYVRGSRMRADCIDGTKCVEICRSMNNFYTSDQAPILWLVACCCLFDLSNAVTKHNLELFWVNVHLKDSYANKTTLKWCLTSVYMWFNLGRPFENQIDPRWSIIGVAGLSIRAEIAFTSQST